MAWGSARSGDSVVGVKVRALSTTEGYLITDQVNVLPNSEKYLSYLLEDFLNKILYLKDLAPCPFCQITRMRGTMTLWFRDNAVVQPTEMKQNFY